MTLPMPSTRLSSAAALCALCLAGPALADDYPARKPGLWEISIQTDRAGARRPMGAVQQCMDAATDKLMRDTGSAPGKRDCSKQDFRHEGGNLVVDSVCRIDMGTGATTATTHAVISGDFSSAYHMESRSTYSPPFMGRADGAVTMDAKWLGPCQPGQKPGDMMMPGGMKMNILDALGSAPKK